MLKPEMQQVTNAGQGAILVIAFEPRAQIVEASAGQAGGARSVLTGRRTDLVDDTFHPFGFEIPMG